MHVDMYSVVVTHSYRSHMLMTFKCMSRESGSVFEEIVCAYGLTYSGVSAHMVGESE